MTLICRLDFIQPSYFRVSFFRNLNFVKSVFLIVISKMNVENKLSALSHEFMD